MIDLDAEMQKEPEDRAPGTFAALIEAAIEHGRSIGQELDPADEAALRDAAKGMS